MPTWIWGSPRACNPWVSLGYGRTVTSALRGVDVGVSWGEVWKQSPKTLHEAWEGEAWQRGSPWEEHGRGENEAKQRMSHTGSQGQTLSGPISPVEIYATGFQPPPRYCPWFFCTHPHQFVGHPRPGR